jgi:hypothetical protein
MIVRTDGCYEYHMNHQDTVDAKDDTARPILEVYFGTTKLPFVKRA